ncbi:hypothetical protein V1264_024563 [Littorina saxatilis]|uniref:RING-type domain-containing protein n=1 Tax=Littorina saxatilis TaxID=31220 RepID=A0AAN9FZS5_9CAEN
MSLQTTHHDQPPVVSTPLNTLRDESDADYGHEQRISTEDSVQEGHSQDEAMNPRSSPSEGPKFSKMASPEARFSTYDSWHLRKMHPPEKLAEAGFFYLEDGSSKVACFYSGMTITVNAGSYADPLEEHARCCHDCPFLLADHQKGPVLLQGTSEGTLKTRGPGKSKEDTQKTPETVRAPEQSSSQQFGTKGLAPTPSTNNSLGSTSKASGQQTIVTASSTCKQNEGKNLALEPRATDQLALSCNDAAAPEAFDIQQAEIQSRAETAESTGSAEKVSSKATASEAPDEIIRAKKEQLAALAALKAKEEGPGNTFQTLASGVVENIEGSEKHKDIVSACVGSDKSEGEDILVSRHGANSTKFQADTNPETETEGNLCIPPLATDDPYGQQLSTGAYRGNDQQTGDTPASSKKASDKNIEDTHSNTGGVVKDITVSRTAVGGQHGAASSPTVTNQTRHEAVGTAIEKNVQCTDFYISSPATSLLHKDKLTVQNGQMCTEESPAGMVFDEQGIETAGASSLIVSGAYADDFFKLPIQEQGESNTNSTSSTMNTARWQENHPPSPLGKREEDAGLSDTQKAKDSEPIYVTSDDKLWHPKCPLSTGVQPDASTICGRQQRISQKDHHQETCAVQVSVNSARQQEKPVSMQHTHSCSKHDQSEAARTQPSGSMPHHDSTQKHIASSHPQAPESALCSLNYLQERKDDAVPENWEDNNDSESDDEQAEDDLGTGGGGSSGDGNGDDDENNDGNDNNSGDGDEDEDEDDESNDGNNSRSSEDDGAEGAAPQDLIGYNIYAGVDIDIREATLPCLHCRVAEKQVQLPCSHRNLCFKCFFCKQFWRQHLLHGPPRCLLCEEEFTDIDAPYVFLLALAFNHRRQRRTNCGCGYRGG